MKKFILIYNPLSGDASFKNRLDDVIEYLKQHHAVALPYRTSIKEDAPGFVSLAREVRADGIIVAGGDGTLHEVINVMLKSGLNLPIGIIPSGTCNDFAGYLGLGYNVSECCRLIVQGKTRDVDVGKANDGYFLNVASAGLLTSVAHNVDTPLKNTLGRLAYYLKGLSQLPRFRTIEIRITADNQLIQGDILFFLVMNSGTAGSFPRLAPYAQIDDSKLDLLVVHKCRITELMTLFLNIMSGSHINHRHITYLQAEKMIIESEDNVESDLDGELGPNLPLTISTVTKQLKIYSD